MHACVRACDGAYVVGRVGAIANAFAYVDELSKYDGRILFSSSSATMGGKRNASTPANA